MTFWKKYNNALFLSFYVQVDDIGFSLNHPNQYFVESQRLLSGGREPKKELSNSGNSQQKNNSQESTNSNSTPTSSNTTADAELEGLEAYFTEDWAAVLFGVFFVCFGLFFFFLQFFPFSSWICPYTKEYALHYLEDTGI